MLNIDKTQQMLTYFLGGYNNYRIRTKQLPSGSTYLKVDFQNMATLDDYSFAANPGQWSYNECESMVDISFNLEIPLNVISGDEYRMSLSPGIPVSNSVSYRDEVWYGSLQVFPSQSINKPAYVNQIPIASGGEDQVPCEISRQSDNEYIIYESDCPQPPSTTTTTAGPTTTTTSTTSTTTTSTTSTTTTSTSTTTTTTTAAPGTVNANFYFNDQYGGMGFDVCCSGSTDGTIPFVAVEQYHLLMSSDAGCTIPYGTVWSKTPGPPVGFGLPTVGNIACTSGGSIMPGNFYRTRVSGSLRFQTPLGNSTLQNFDISGSGFQDLTFSGYTLRVHAAGCTLNNAGASCP